MQEVRFERPHIFTSFIKNVQNRPIFGYPLLVSGHQVSLGRTTEDCLLKNTVLLTEVTGIVVSMVVPSQDSYEHINITESLWFLQNREEYYKLNILV